MELNKKEIQDNLHPFLEMAFENSLFDLIDWIVTEMKPVPDSISVSLASRIYEQSKEEPWKLSDRVTPKDREHSENRIKYAQKIMTWGGTLYFAHAISQIICHKNYVKAKELIAMDPQVLNVNLKGHYYREDGRRRSSSEINGLMDNLSRNAQQFYSVFINHKDVIKDEFLISGIRSLDSAPIIEKILKKLPPEVINRRTKDGETLGARLIKKPNINVKHFSGLQATMKDILCAVGAYSYYMSSKMEAGLKLAPYVTEFETEDNFRKYIKRLVKNGENQTTALVFGACLSACSNCPSYIVEFTDNLLQKVEEIYIKEKEENGYYRHEIDEEAINKIKGILNERMLKDLMKGGAR